MKKIIKWIVLLSQIIIYGTVLSFIIGLLLAYPMCMMNLGDKVSNELLGIILIAFSSIVGFGVVISAIIEPRQKP